ncbi:chromosome partitioning protein ParB, partial [Streptomyces sp. NPDC059411]
MSERRRGLGRGLGALIPAAPQEKTPPVIGAAGSISPSAVPVLTAERGIAAAKLASLAQADFLTLKNAPYPRPPPAPGPRGP